MTPRILIAIDPDRPEPQIVEVGAAMAVAVGASIILAAVSPDTGAAGATLEELAVAAGDSPIEVWVTVSATPARTLQRLARERACSMIVVGTGRHHGLGQLGSVASRLLHGAPCQVLVVPYRHSRRDAAIRRVAVAFVPTRDGRAALAAAAALSRALRAELEIVTVLPHVAWNDVGAPPPVILGTPGSDEIHQLRRDELECAAATAACDLAIDARVEIVEGDPATALCDVSRRVELLVCGSRGQGAVAGLLLGGVSRRLVHEAHCPVLVVPRHPGLRGAGPGAETSLSAAAFH